MSAAKARPYSPLETVIRAAEGRCAEATGLEGRRQAVSIDDGDAIAAIERLLLPPLPPASAAAATIGRVPTLAEAEKKMRCIAAEQKGGEKGEEDGGGGRKRESE